MTVPPLMLTFAAVGFAPNCAISVVVGEILLFQLVFVNQADPPLLVQSLTFEFAIAGVTLFEAALAALVPIPLVAVTVNV